MRPVPIHTQHITLGAFLKFAGLARTGSEAKRLVAAGNVTVNGEVETRRGRKLRPGDRVSVAGVGAYLVERAHPPRQGG